MCGVFLLDLNIRFYVSVHLIFSLWMLVLMSSEFNKSNCVWISPPFPCRYVGSLSGLVYIFALPCMVYHRREQLYGTINNYKRVIHFAIIAIGVANLIAQFLI